MKKKVIIFIPSIEDGGVEKNLFIISNFLAKKINNLKLITTTDTQKKKFSKKINYISYKGILFDNFNRRIKYFLCLILLLKEYFKNKNIIILSFQANLYCIIFAKIFGLKVIIRSNSAPIGWSKNFFKKKIYNFIINKADKIIVNSFEFKNEMKKYFNVKSECIYNPLNYLEIIRKTKDKKPKTFKKKNIFNIINIGRIVDQKDQITILKALNYLIKQQKFEKFKFSILGKGNLEKNLKKYVKKNSLSKYVNFLGYKKNPIPYLKKADLFILSSKYEGLPNVILEAQTLKVPIISSNCKTGPLEILKNGKYGLIFEVGNYTQLAKKILIYYNNKKIVKKHINSGFKSLHRFDKNKNLKKYLFLVNNFLK